MSSSFANPSCTLLMTDNSAVRCSVSFNKRFVSSNRRALSKATLILLANVVSRLASLLENACSWSRFCRLMTPFTSLPVIMGTYTCDLGTSPIRISLPNSRMALSTFSLCRSNCFVSITCFRNPFTSRGPSNVLSPFS